MDRTNTESSPKQTFDLTNCEREPLHLLGNVQAYGCLIATSIDFMIQHASQNSDDILGLDPDTITGRRLMEILPESTVHDLRTKLQMININAGAGRLFGYDVLGDGRLYDVSVHAIDHAFVFEFEPKTDLTKRDEMSVVQPLIGRVRRADSVEAACQQAAMAVQALSGFDRVMVYQFSEDGSGQVVAEQKKIEAKAYLGLRFPASDIPRQARELYKRSVLRLIADVDGDVSPIVPDLGATGQPLDLSLAVTRAVSPTHLEYLRNMGVAASMSVSILRNGELWGLFACHHDTPRYVDYERRTAIELFSQFFAYELSEKIEASIKIEDQNSRRLHERLMIRLSSGADLVDSFDVISEELAQLMPNDGIAIYSEGRFIARGATPSREEFMKLARFLNTVPTGRIFSTSHLSKNFPPAEDYQDRVAGLMAVPISRTPRDFIVFFRREIARSVRWGGDPEKPVTLGPNGIRLTPRKSFEAWTEIVRGTSSEWTETEGRIGEALRVSLIEIVLKLTDEANVERRRASDKQDLLIAELNHRVRNILNLIQGLVSQSRSNAKDLKSFTKTLDGRIQSLARAHDLLTRQEWAATSLRQLIDIEVQAFLSGQADRLVVTGDHPMIQPEAFSTVALVLHELVTNSAKYGALVDHSGHVHVDLRIQPDGALTISWIESGGPAVRAPTHRGFGSTVIEKTIPYDLQGKAETRFPLTGFEADFMIPQPYISDDQDTARPDEAPALDRTAIRGHRLSGDYLVLEDNLIIATEAADVLTAMGADQVHMAGSVADALALIDAYPIQFGVLDVNLGAQTSLPVARRMRDLGIPFVLATGYGDVDSITSSYPQAPVLQKPFTADTLTSTIVMTLKEMDG